MPANAGANGRSRGRRGHASGGNPNQQLFFSRLRRQAKFLYLVLAGLLPALVIAHLLRAHHAPHVRLLSAVALSSGPLVAAALWFLSRP